jgi:hypothetical protein
LVVKIAGALCVVLAVAVGIAAASAIGSLDDKSQTGIARPSAPPDRETPDPSLAAELAKPYYVGLLGDFEIEPRKVAEYPPCDAVESAPVPEASELHSAGFKVTSTAKCADGTAMDMTFAGEGAPDTIGRRYFVGPARLPYEASEDRLMLLEVGGRPAIVQLPMPEHTATLRLAVIERFPSGEKPGILLWVENSLRSVDEAAALAEQIMTTP